MCRRATKPVRPQLWSLGATALGPRRRLLEALCAETLCSAKQRKPQQRSPPPQPEKSRAATESQRGQKLTAAHKLIA